MADIVHLLHIDAPIQVIFEAISTIEGQKNWWTKFVDGNDDQGEIIHFQFGNAGFIKFEVTEKRPYGLYRWKCYDGHPEWVGTDVCFQLTEVDDKICVKFIHSGWQHITEFFANCNFNWGKYLWSLKGYCEMGKGNPFLG